MPRRRTCPPGYRPSVIRALPTTMFDGRSREAESTGREHRLPSRAQRRGVDRTSVAGSSIRRCRRADESCSRRFEYLRREWATVHRSFPCTADVDQKVVAAIPGSPVRPGRSVAGCGFALSLYRVVAERRSFNYAYKKTRCTSICFWLSYWRFFIDAFATGRHWLPCETCGRGGFEGRAVVWDARASRRSTLGFNSLAEPEAVMVRRASARGSDSVCMLNGPGNRG